MPVRQTWHARLLDYTSGVHARVVRLRAVDVERTSTYIATVKTFKTAIIGLIAISAFNMTARAELEAAEHNKGGWRVRAIQNTDRAITETQNGMAVGARQ